MTHRQKCWLYLSIILLCLLYWAFQLPVGAAADTDGTATTQYEGTPTALPPAYTCPLSKGWNLTVPTDRLAGCGPVWIYLP